MALREPQRKMKMGPRWRSVYAAASATEAELLWRKLSPHTSMAGTLRSTTNCSLQKLRRARVGDFRFFEASNAARWRGVARWKSDTPRGAGGLVSGAASKAVVPLVEASR